MALWTLSISCLISLPASRTWSRLESQTVPGSVHGSAMCCVWARRWRLGFRSSKNQSFKSAEVAVLDDSLSKACIHLNKDGFMPESMYTLHRRAPYFTSSDDFRPATPLRFDAPKAIETKCSATAGAVERKAVRARVSAASTRCASFVRFISASCF